MPRDQFTSQISMVIEKNGSFIEHLPINPEIELVDIQFGAGNTKTNIKPVVWNTSDILPRFFDNGELKWKLHTKKLVDLINPIMVPREINLMVRSKKINSQISVFSAVDEFYKIGVELKSQQQSFFRRRCIGREGFLEFISFTKDGEVVPIKKGIHPHVVGEGQGALNLLVVVEEKDGKITRSPYYPVIRQGVIRPDDFWQRDGKCFASPDNKRIAFQSLSLNGNGSSVFTCNINGTGMRDIAGSIATSVALYSVEAKEFGGWRSKDKIMVFVKNANNDSWEPNILDDCENASSTPC